MKSKLTRAELQRWLHRKQGYGTEVLDMPTNKLIELAKNPKRKLKLKDIKLI